LTLLPPWKWQFAGQNIGAGQSAATTKPGELGGVAFFGREFVAQLDDVHAQLIDVLFQLVDLGARTPSVPVHTASLSLRDIRRLARFS